MFGNSNNMCYNDNLRANKEKIMENMIEIWKPIKNFKNKYYVSDTGLIKNNKDKLLTPRPNKKGYLRVDLWKNNKKKHYRVHRLVAMAFIPNPQNKPQVNHKDGNKQNNCVDNLEWCTNEENRKHAIANGLVRGRGRKFLVEENNNERND